MPSAKSLQCDGSIWVEFCIKKLLKLQYRGNSALNLFSVYNFKLGGSFTKFSDSPRARMSGDTTTPQAREELLKITIEELASTRQPEQRAHLCRRFVSLSYCVFVSCYSYLLPPQDRLPDQQYDFGRSL